MPDGQHGQGGRWLPLREAGPRLGLAPDSIRKRIRRGGWPADRYRRDNSGAWSVFVPDVPDTTPDLSAAAVPDVRPDLPDLSGTVAELRAHVATLEKALEVERARVDRLMEALAERQPAPAPPPPRRWWRWWRGG